MKALFMLVSLLCAACLGLLSYIMVTGKIPMHSAPVPAAVATNAPVAPVAPAPKTTAIPEEQKKRVETLVQELADVKRDYEKRKEDMEGARDKESLAAQKQVLELLVKELKDREASLGNQIQTIDETELKNLQMLSDKFSKMEPESAAQIMILMEKNRAAMLLYLMAERQSAAILDAVTLLGNDAKKTTVEWTDIIRKLKNETSKKGATKP